jgi:hypothetical protein
MFVQCHPGDLETYALAAAFRPPCFRSFAQYFVIRKLAALRAAADIRRRGRSSALVLLTRPAPFAKINGIGSSSLSNESRRCGNNPMRFLV